MNYTEILNTIKNATLFDLYRLTQAMESEMNNSERIKQLRKLFKEGDTISYFDENINGLQSAIVLQKNVKNVLVKNCSDGRNWSVPYYMLNLANVNTDIEASRNEKLTRNHLTVGECVGFNHDGEQIVGIIIRLNYKTITLRTKENRTWRVYYASLYKVIDSEVARTFDRALLGGWVKAES